MSGSAASVDTLSRPDSRAKAADVGDRRQTIDGIAPGKDLCRESAVFADPYRHVFEEKVLQKVETRIKFNKKGI